jgi:uncharacterized protein YqhQ
MEARDLGKLLELFHELTVACRMPDESISVESHPLPTIMDRHPWMKWPFIRGCIVLGESLAIGIRALMISANKALEEEEQLTNKQLGWTLGTAMVFFTAIFIAIPLFGTKLFENYSGDLVTERPLLFNVIEGTIRLSMFVGYLLLIGQFKDIKRVFQYHGAEHKTIYAYENGDPLDPALIDGKYSTLHVRCGTNFLFIVLTLTILSYFVIDLFLSAAFLPRLTFRILKIPVLAGLSYEVIKLASRKEESLLFKITMLPGLALQKITTKPPTHDQIEVAIEAMKAVARDIERDAEGPSTPVS